ncbi:MAG: YebC/PmpR family DNA-binding transcriptional regulator [Oscillospiraceae bacterium]|jgi:YebC/PmpR family DNA-binding regulatory protein|nr:YebC/PmpR family DNA-binding transcriptional regulator [Oscillospiraceae bacterium]
MSGHSKWKNILHKKERTDAQRAKVFTKLSREIIVAVKEGGPDPDANARLKDCIAKARAGNVPNDNIKRVIERASGSGGAENYESARYEGYGPGGTAVIVGAMTDNRNRTAGEIRHYFDKFGGNLGTTGCVSWFFERKGILAVDAEGRDEDTLMALALDAGASDFSASDGFFEIEAEPDDFPGVRDALEAAGISFLSAQVEMVPQNWVSLGDGEDAKKMRRLLDALEDNDDVQDVWHNWEDEE